MGGDTALDGTTTHPSNSGERKRNDEASTDMMQRSCNGVDSGMGMRMNHFPFAGGILSDFPITPSPSRLIRPGSKTGKVGGMDPESAGTGRTVRGRGRDWVPLTADGLGWGGEKLGDQSHDTLMSCLYSSLTEAAQGERREEAMGRRDTRARERNTENGEWIDKSKASSLPHRTQHAYPIFSPPHLSSTQPTHHASAAMVGQDEL